MGKTRTSGGDDAIETAGGVTAVGQKDVDRQRNEHPSAVDQALAERRIEDLTRANAELKATRSELQYDLSVSLEALAEEQKQAVVAEERKQAAVAEERHRAEIAEEEHRGAVAAAQLRAAIAEERQRASIAERDNEAARKSATVARQLADLRERLSLVVHDRKSLRRELQRRARLLTRVRSELRAAQKSVAVLQQSVRGLERANWVLEREAAGNKAWNKQLREQNAESARLIDQLGDGFHAVRVSRRWRLGSALLSVPRRLLFRPKVPATPEDMLGLVAEHRWRRTKDVRFGRAMDEG